MLNIEGIYVETTTECNLRCKHCYNDSGAKKNCLTINNVRTILEYAHAHELQQISLSGGEPLLHPYIVEIIAMITREYGMKVTIVSNIMAVNQDFLDRVRNECDIQNVIFQVSADGCNEQEHDFIRGIGSFKKMLQALHMLRRNNVSYYFHTMIHQENYNNLSKMIEFAIANQSERLEFTFLKKKGRGELNYNDIALPAKLQIDVIDQLENYKECYKDRINLSAPSTFFGICPFISDDDEFDIFLRIDPRGNAFTCQNMTLDELSIGNINDTAMEELVSLETMFNLRSKLKRIMQEKAKCNNCLVSFNCGGGCPGVECMDNFEHYSDECEERRLMYKERLSSFINNCSRKT